MSFHANLPKRTIRASFFTPSTRVPALVRTMESMGKSNRAAISIAERRRFSFLLSPRWVHSLMVSLEAAARGPCLLWLDGERMPHPV